MLATRTLSGAGTLDERSDIFLPPVIIVLYPSVLPTGRSFTAFLQARIRNHVRASTVVDGRIRLKSTIGAWPSPRLLVGNFALPVIALGLAHRWTRGRVARFPAAATAALAAGELHSVVEEERIRQDAFGEELGDAFDLAMDVGL